MRTETLGAQEARSLFAYNPATGKLLWRTAPSERASGGFHLIDKRAGTLTPTGYRRVTVGGRRYLEHRLIWLIANGVWPKQLDHINGSRDDNRIANLREATQTENMRNQKPRRSVSGLKGAYLDRRTGRFVSRIRLEGRHVHVGTFDTAEEAHKAYCAAADQHYGEFARHA